MSVLLRILTHLMPLVSFLPPNRRKAVDFLILLKGIEKDRMYDVE